MADLPESNEWPEGIYQLETSDPVLGGPDGIDNLQAKQLASRTTWLKDQIAKIVAGTSVVGKALQLKTARTLNFKGAATGSGSYDGSADTEITLTLADSGVGAGSFTKVSVSSQGLVTGGNNPTTLGGYGITDAYPKTATYSKPEIEAMIAQASAQATEANQGTAKIATQAQVNAGTDDATIVTPKKLRLGFAILLAINGFIAFPSWLGGFVFQWGRITINQSTINGTASGNWLFPMQFPTACLSAWAFQHALGGTGGSLLERLCGNGEPAINGATFLICDADTAGNYTLRTFAIGS